MSETKIKQLFDKNKSLSVSNKYKLTYHISYNVSKILFLVYATYFVFFVVILKIFPMTHPFNIYQRVIFVIIRHAYH